jgi:hypothetical protein
VWHDDESVNFKLRRLAQERRDQPIDKYLESFAGKSSK